MVGATVADATMVDDSMTTEPSEVTCDVCTKVVVVGVADITLEDGAAVVVVADDTTVSDADPAVADAPVERLTCLLSSLAKAWSISLAGTVAADMMAKNRMVGKYILAAVVNNRKIGRPRSVRNLLRTTIKVIAIDENMCELKDQRGSVSLKI